ncbi:hypothetical protein E4U42_005142 [Claviceps africana]|uniref:Mitochondrial adapter protein MCP1 transmembrane domain-containing protein n=1 Tax=Claviceps africana TaxID=83212 RepID=A0A8K0J6C0_9HYPO|nr:hypothetical protein E4U42_005142 [Claviceps africana]
MNRTSGQGLHGTESPDAPGVLLELDPSPMDSPSIASLDSDVLLSDESEDGGRMGVVPRETTLSGGTARAPGLHGHGGRSAIFYLTRLQKYSSYAMGLFTGLHLANVSLIPAMTRTVPGSEAFLLMTREIYQTPLAEPMVVFLPVLAHVGSGVALRLLRRWQNMKRYGGRTPGLHALGQLRDSLSGTSPGGGAVRLWPRLSWISVSGYALTACYGAHAFVNRALPLLVEGDSSDIGLAYVAHGFARHPLASWAAYLALLGAAAGHMVWGMARWLGRAPSTDSWRGERGVVAADKKTRRARRRQWLGVHGVSVGVAALWAVGGLGVVARGGLAEGWVGKVYDVLFERVGL